MPDIIKMETEIIEVEDKEKNLINQNHVFKIIRKP
jgi:hypothetical protein